MEARIRYPMPTRPHTLSRTWPEPATVEELGATALASCAGAAGRYTALAEEMERHGQRELAAAFEQLARDQKALEQAILDRGARPREGAVHAGPAAWAGTEDADGHDEEALNPHLSTPYKALAFAVRNAEQAFRFYSYVTATAGGDAMRVLAEWLAKEELAQAARLRRRRRRAYHARRAAGGTARAPNPRHVDSLADLLAAAAAMERRISDHLAKAAAAAAALAGFETPGKDGDEETLSRETRLALAQGERAFAFYSAVVDTASDEAVMLEAQRLSQDALRVISTLRTTKN